MSFAVMISVVMAAKWRAVAKALRSASSVMAATYRRRDAIAGLVESGDGRTALAMRVAAPPVEGAANKALIAEDGATRDLVLHGVDTEGYHRYATEHDLVVEQVLGRSPSVVYVLPEASPLRKVFHDLAAS